MKRRIPTLLILFVMMLIGVAYWIDIAYYTDLRTGFSPYGTVWMRYGVVAIPILMSLLGLFTVGPRSLAVLRVRSKPLTLLFTLAGLSGITWGVLQFISLFRLFNAYTCLLSFFTVWYGLWMLSAARQFYKQANPSPTRSALWGIGATLPFVIITVYRILIKPGGLYRTAPVVQAFSSLLSLLWFGFLLRALYIALPRRRVRWVYFMGVLTFLFATCLELPLVVYAFVFGGSPTAALFESLNIALFGLAAGGISVAISGQSDAPPKQSTPQDDT